MIQVAESEALVSESPPDALVKPHLVTTLRTAALEPAEEEAATQKEHRADWQHDAATHRALGTAGTVTATASHIVSWLVDMRPSVLPVQGEHR